MCSGRRPGSDGGRREAPHQGATGQFGCRTVSRRTPIGLMCEPARCDRSLQKARRRFQDPLQSAWGRRDRRSHPGNTNSLCPRPSPRRAPRFSVGALLLLRARSDSHQQCSRVQAAPCSRPHAELTTRSRKSQTLDRPWSRLRRNRTHRFFHANTDRARSLSAPADRAAGCPTSWTGRSSSAQILRSAG